MDDINLSKKKFGDESDGEEYFFMNVGYGKYNPGGTSSAYKGKKVPYFVEFFEGEGISGHIITKVISHLYDLKLNDNDRENGIIPALLVDGHVRPFDMGFLKYI